MRRCTHRPVFIYVVVDVSPKQAINKCCASGSGALCCEPVGCRAHRFGTVMSLPRAACAVESMRCAVGSPLFVPMSSSAAIRLGRCSRRSGPLSIASASDDRGGRARARQTLGQRLRVSPVVNTRRDCVFQLATREAWPPGVAGTFAGVRGESQVPCLPPVDAAAGGAAVVVSMVLVLDAIAALLSTCVLTAAPSLPWQNLPQHRGACCLQRHRRLEPRRGC